MIRCYVTDRRRGDVLAAASRAMRDGIDYIQIREKDLSALELLRMAESIVELRRSLAVATRILINDRLDVALACGVDGIHLPGNGLPAERVRPLVRVLGVSTHTIAEAQAAERAKADFIIFGPVFETPGKKPVGVEALQEVTTAVHIPVLAIGGATTENAALLLAAGAAGIAGIRLFQKIF